MNAIKVSKGWKVQLHTFVSSAVDLLKWSASRYGHFYLGKRTSLRIEYGEVWTPEGVRKFCRREKSLPFPENRIWFVGFQAHSPK